MTITIKALPTRRNVLAGAALATWGCSWSGRSAKRLKGRPALGFLRQIDAASLLMADELGAYAKNDLAPSLVRASQPGELKDRLLSGELVAAQLPASFPVLKGAAGGQPPDELVTLMVLSENGGAVTLGKELCGGMKFLDLPRLKQALSSRRRSAHATAVPTFAVPAIGGVDDLWLRYLLAATGLGPEHYRVVATAPERMLADLREERLAGFAAPDPWPALAAIQDVGFTFATAQDICRRAPRSVLVTTTRTLNQRRSELKSLVRAIMEASVWLDVPANRGRAVLGETLARRQYLDLDAAPVRARLGGVYDLGCQMGERDFEDDVLAFHRSGRVNLPLQADALLYLALLQRFAVVPTAVDPVTMPEIARETIRDEIYREVARDTGVPLPSDMKPFIVTVDAVRFDPNRANDWKSLWAVGQSK